jgi:hypothetical protein
MDVNSVCPALCTSVCLSVLRVVRMRNVSGGSSQSVPCNMSIKSLCTIHTYIHMFQRREAVSSYFISTPGGLSDVCLEMGRGMTSILLLFIKMELVYWNSVSRQTVIDIKCRYARVLCVTVLRVVVIWLLAPSRSETSPGYPSWGPEFDERAVYVRILVDEMALRENYLRVLRCFPISVISLTLHAHLWLLHASKDTV